MQTLDHDHYTKVKKIPGGAYGKIYIYKCEKPIQNRNIFPWISQPKIEEEQPQFVVIKKFRPLKKKIGLDIDSLREVRFKSIMNHENLNDVKHIFVKPSKKKDEENFGSICFVYDYMISLYNLLYKETNEAWRESDIQKMMYQVLKGMEVLHSRMILHRDIKPENILIAKDGTLKITDFGLARLWEDKPMTTQTCTLQYRSPELYFNSSYYGPSIDIWALGCVFAELYLRKPLFYGENEIKVLAQMVTILGNPTESNWPGYEKLPRVKYFEKRAPVNLQKLLPKMNSNGINLLSQMIQYDPNKRISVANALKHPYFDDLKMPANQYSEKLMQIIQNLLK